MLHRKQVVKWVFVAAVAVLVAVWAIRTVAEDLTLGVGDFDSWGWIGVSQDQTADGAGTSTTSVYGFVHLNCFTDDTIYCSPEFDSQQYPNLIIDFAAADPNDTIRGWGWLGTGDSGATGTPHSLGWLDFDPDPLPDGSPYGDTVNCPAGSVYPAEPCHPARISTDNQQELSGWARLPSLAEEGDNTLGSTGGDNDWGWVLLRGTNTADNNEFGLTYNNGTLEGWAWSGSGSVIASETTGGLGWINFSNAGQGSATGPTESYLSTVQGDVYVQGGIGNPDLGTLDPSQYNASFLILSSTEGSVTNFNSELLDGAFIDDTSPQIDLPDSGNQYRSQLGRIDIERITNSFTAGTNVDGDTVVLMGPAGLTGNVFLDGRVIMLGQPTNVTSETGTPNASYTLSDTITFTNGTNTGDSGSNYNGAGTIVVNGDLVIDANMYYGASPLVDIRNLASVAWIVRGDLTIGENVTQIVGSFLVLGDDNIGDSETDGTITTLPTSQSQLNVYGLMMARAFNFQRTYQGTATEDEPSERLYYDGRVLLNTPSGLRDAVANLPIID